MTKRGNYDIIITGIKAEDNDWITINGTHVEVDEGGNLQGAVGDKITSTSKPNATAKPTAPTKPAATSNPVEPTKPIEEQKPSTNVISGDTMQPAASDKPVPSGEDAAQPENIGRSGHPEFDGKGKSFQQKVTGVRERLNGAPDFTAGELEDAVDAVGSYSGGNYDVIHRNTPPDGTAANERIDKLLEKLPKYDGETYRGVSLPKDTALAQIAALKNGETLQLGDGATSWSSDRKVAAAFSKSDDFSNYRIAYSVKQTNKGASITDMSLFGGKESEVLVPGKVSYALAGKIKQNSKGIWEIPLKEV
ncbi:hypothetical protein AGMMS49992_20180 [Clostridia bacterium]|nr:hypothetical protein AGMMS49992_20180 [Clostridia bacterium]